MAKINSFDFGSIVINRKHYSCDVLVLPDGTIKEREPTKGRHKISAKEIENLHNMQADITVIGNGTNGNAKLTGNATKYLENNKFDPLILNTPLAVDRFNREISNRKRVAALIHVTC